MRDLKKLITDRIVAIEKMNQLLSEKHEIEHNIFKTLIDNGMTDLLTINWKKLEREVLHERASK